MEDLLTSIDRIPPGYSEVRYQGRRYSLSRRDYADGKSIKVFARELGGTDIISFNCYLTGTGGAHLKPCEMPKQKVVDFLQGYEFMT